MRLIPSSDFDSVKFAPTHPSKIARFERWPREGADRGGGQLHVGPKTCLVQYIS